MKTYMNCRKISRSSSVKIRSHPGTKTENLMITQDQLPKKNPPKNGGYQSGTNEITIKVNTMQKIRKLINAIKENDMTVKTEIILSSVIYRDNQDLEHKINEFHKEVENLCKGKGMHFIDNSNIKSVSLNRRNYTLTKEKQVS